MSAPKSKRKARRVMIVDDHPITRDGLALLIEREPDLVVAWQAENAAQALEITRTEEPDIALVDITLPGKSGLELLKDFRAMHPELKVLVISMHNESLYAERALRAGARGYICKQEGGEKLMEAIRTVLRGEIAVSGETTARIMQAFSGRQTAGGQSPVGILSDREFEIFQLLGEGLSAPEIGERLCISAKTVETHRLNIKAKLEIGSAAELVAFAARWAATGE
jgi:DNA-binding NarL/FixJ family response regulator